MAPSLPEGAFLLVSSLGRIRLGDIIVFINPSTKRDTVKRVVKFLESGYFVEGDNLTRSTDSRHFGPIGRDLIRGKVLCELRPTFRWYI